MSKRFHAGIERAERIEAERRRREEEAEARRRKQREEEEAERVRKEAEKAARQRELQRQAAAVPEDQLAEACAAVGANCELLAGELKTVTEDVRAYLETVLPALESGLRALDCLDKRDFCDVRSFANPPQVVLVAMELACELFGVRPERVKGVDGRLCTCFLGPATRLFSDGDFVSRMKNYDKDNMIPLAAQRAQACLDRAGPEMIETARSFPKVRAIIQWAVGVLQYHAVAVAIAPKRERLSALQTQLEEATKWLSALVTQQDCRADP